MAFLTQRGEGPSGDAVLRQVLRTRTLDEHTGRTLEWHLMLTAPFRTGLKRDRPTVVPLLAGASDGGAETLSEQVL